MAYTRCRGVCGVHAVAPSRRLMWAWWRADMRVLACDSCCAAAAACRTGANAHHLVCFSEQSCACCRLQLAPGLLLLILVCLLLCWGRGRGISVCDRLLRLPENSSLRHHCMHPTQHDGTTVIRTLLTNSFMATGPGPAGTLMHSDTPGEAAA
jgi:hypothetical protein